MIKSYKSLSERFRIDKIGKAEFQEVFWLSLLDPTSAAYSSLEIDLDEHRKLIKKELEKLGVSFNTEKHINDFIDSQFFGGKITSLMLAHLLDRNGIYSNPEAKIGGVLSADVYVRLRKLAIEIKRPYSSGGIYKDIEDTADKYNKHKCPEINKVLMLFIHPLEDCEKSFEWATDGYKSLFHALKEDKNIPSNFEFCILSFENKSGELDTFINSVCIRLNEIK